MSLITCTNLTNAYDNVDRTSYTTASVTLTAGKLHLIGVAVRNNTATASPTLSGTGTWTEIDNGTNAVDTMRVCLFACVPASNATGAVTIDFAGVTQVGCAWSIEQFANTAVGPTSTSSVIQASSSLLLVSATSLSVTLNNFSHTQNATYGFGAVQLNEAISAGGGFAVTGQANGATPNFAYLGEFKNNNDTSVDMSWTTSNGNAAIIGAEIAHSPYPKVITI